MNAIIIIISLSLALLSCSQKNEAELSSKEIEYYYVEYNIECCTMAGVLKQKMLHSTTVKDSMYTLTYIIEGKQKPDTLIYRLKENHTYIPQYEYNTIPDKLFSLVGSTSILVWGDSLLTRGLKDTYKVYKYASNGASMDGCYSHFWIPQFGIILKRNPTWRNFQKLRTNNDSINRQIELLTDIIYQDQDFYRGCDFELPDEGFEVEREQMIAEREKKLVERQKKILEKQKRSRHGTPSQ
ncbi:hypothetical protein GXP67_32095 [Rhodocytophaga rosea]|uniref:Uncharacterized protein n=1 Tax=Rhodocytophaga rosea TaxID=2704465 RepID=A0A6C0GS86_9BACT|nr:hypothetical protein [Rhodocytophaga rosea]QHT70961.1 hypothetical protein GXP67_32095 [Rhodocytophaga rosea]